MMKPLCLQPLNPSEVRATNQLFALEPLTFAIGERPARLHFNHQAYAFEAVQRFDIFLGNHRICLEASVPLLEDDQLLILPDDVLLAMLEIELIEPLETLSHCSGLSTRLAAHQEQDYNHCLNGVLTIENRRIDLRLMLDADCLERLAQLAAQVKRVEPTIDHMRLRGSLQLGSTSLSIQQVQHLVADDLILLDPQPQDQTLNLCFPGGLQIRCRQDQRDLYVEEIMSVDTLENPLSKTDQLEIQLSFVAGTHAICLGQIKQLKAGQVLTLNQEPSTQVDIMANETKIGRGELVSVDAFLGVRILEVYSHEL